MVERAAQGGRNRPGSGAYLQHAPVVVMTHHHAARITRETPRRFRGNARAVLENGFIWLIRIGQGGGVDVM